jgi:hypothetical protein
VAGVYNRFKYRDDVRDALSLWAAHVRRLVEQDKNGSPESGLEEQG